MADGEFLHLAQVSCVQLKVIARGVDSIVTLTDVYLELRLAKNIILHGKLERRGFALVYDGEKRELVRRSDGAVALDVEMDSNVFYVVRPENQDKHCAFDAVIAALEDGATAEVVGDVQESTLLHSHQRFGHLAFDTIEHMARD